MTDGGRRSFVRRLGGLATLSLGGCKIEPILDLPPSTDSQPLAFPDLPPQIPDQLQDAEITLQAITDELLDNELSMLRTGDLHLRFAEDRRAPSYLLNLMRKFGLEPAGNRGGWLVPVPLDIIEPTGGEPRVTLRPESEPTTHIADLGGRSDGDPSSVPADLDGPPSDPDGSPDGDPNNTPAPDNSPPSDPDDGPATDNDPDASPGDNVSVQRRAVELAELGAFRQRGLALPHEGLLVGPVRSYQTPLESDSYAGRVALLRAPKDLDLDSADAPARVDLLLSTIRDAGAIGCLLLTNAKPEAIDQFRELWRRQVRRAGGRDEALLIEGVLGAEGRELLGELAIRDEPWVLDVALATRQFELETQDIVGRVTGRERPHEAVVLTCPWDTPNPDTVEIDTLRLIATIAAFAQLAEWSRRSTPPRYSLILLLTADAGISAGQAVHAAWASHYGAETSVLLALDRPNVEPSPAVSLSGHYDAALADLVRGVVAADGRDLWLVEELALPSLSPYLRYPAPVLAVGAPDPEALAAMPSDSGSDGDETGDGDADDSAEPRAGIHADVRLLRNLALTLAARR